MMHHRALSVILAVVLLLSAMPAAATAEESPEVDPIVGVWYSDMEATTTPALGGTMTRVLQLYAFDPDGNVYSLVMPYKPGLIMQEMYAPILVGHWVKDSQFLYTINPDGDYVGNINLKPAILVSDVLYLHVSMDSYLKCYKMTPIGSGDHIDDTYMDDTIPYLK